MHAKFEGENLKIERAAREHFFEMGFHHME
jgi:hypothetical protein